MISIIITDDHQIFRESLTELLTKKGFKIIGTASNGKQLLKLLETTMPDLILMDIAMPEMDGFETTKKVLEIYPDLRIITLSSFGDEKYYYNMVQAGVKGFVLKNAGIKELQQAIEEVAQGGSWFSNELLQKIIFSMTNKTGKEEKIKLTDRELEILKLICKGYTGEKMAEELSLSMDTIRTHRTNLLAKTGCNNAPALVMYAIKNKIIEVN